MGLHKRVTSKTALIAIAAFLPLSQLISMQPSSAATTSEYRCADSIASSTDEANTTITTAYQEWKKLYVTKNGAGAAQRVQRDAQDNFDTVSEGIGYGMLFAAYNNDQSLFDDLYKYEQSHLNQNGLMNWKIDASGSTTGYNAATDADEDIALALVKADKTWGGYAAKAKQQIQLIRTHEIEKDTFVLKPGDVWGGSNVLNPSYLAPAYYDVFAAYTGDTSWASVKTAAYKTIDALKQNTPAASTGLLPDWSTNYGSRADGMGFEYGYDAVRAPIRLATSSIWSCDEKVKDTLSSLNTTFKKIGIANVVDGYHLDATAFGTNRSSVASAPAAAVATASSDAAYRTAAWKHLKDTPTTGQYYADSLRVFSLMLSGGAMQDPLKQAPTSPSSQPQPITPPPVLQPAQQAGIDIWWPSDGSTVTGTQPFKVLLQGKSTRDYSMYWQVDGGQLNLMNNNDEDYPHKQSDVDVSNWHWRDSGVYKITFVAKDNTGTTLSSRSTSIHTK